ncbi:MAG: histidine phosphatase family protein [Spirochaetales bacterium]
MIYYVRHGQAIHNLGELFCEEDKEFSLTEKGFEQARETAKALKDIKFDICYCSPKRRTVQTMEEIVKYHPGLKVVMDNRIVERMWGEASGLHISVCDVEPGRWHMDTKFPFEGIESVDDVFKRAKSFYDEICDENKNILVVSHSGFGRVSYCYFHGFPKNRDLKDIVIKNSEVLKFEKVKENDKTV